MATISENIQRINKAKTDIKNAIIAKGGSVADDDKIDTYAQAIEALPSGGGTELPQNLSRLVTDDWGMPKKITIKGSVGIIPDNKYKGCVDLEDVIIGNGVTSIGDSAFGSCENLTSIAIPNGVRSIGSDAFSRCFSLTGITIPNGVRSIGIDAFYYCTSFLSITIPDSVTSIGSGAFFGCSKLTTITIKATTPPSLGSSAMSLTNITAIYVPSDSVDIYKSASGWNSYASKIQPIQ